MKLLKDYMAKLYSFYYFFIWGFYFSAGYFFCKNMKPTRQRHKKPRQHRFLHAARGCSVISPHSLRIRYKKTKSPKGVDHHAVPGYVLHDYVHHLRLLSQMDANGIIPGSIAFPCCLKNFIVL